jgi:hypothetical protein
MCVLQCLESQTTSSQPSSDTTKCICNQGYLWSTQPSLPNQCIVDCSSLVNSLYTNSDAFGCNCVNGFNFNFNNNALPGVCRRDCSNIAHATGLNPTTDPSACQCYPGYTWSATAYPNICSLNCGTVGNLDVNSCNCTNGKIYNQYTGTCQINCQNIANSNGINFSDNQCYCLAGYVWSTSVSYNNSCIINCAVILNSPQTNNDQNSCTCNQNFKWVSSIKKCARDCSTDIHSNGTYNPSDLTQCNCNTNYIWSPLPPYQNLCIINCQNIANSNGNSAVDACLCVTNFKWETNAGANQNTCVRDCTNIFKATGYNVNMPSQCSC